MLASGAGSSNTTTSITRALSATVRVIGPMTSSDAFVGMMPLAGRRPYDGRPPTSAVRALGRRIELPVSPPIAKAHRFAAVAAAEPVLEPPKSFCSVYGLRARPQA